MDAARLDAHEAGLAVCCGGALGLAEASEGARELCALRPQRRFKETADERIAAVNVSCPTCHQVCQLLFDPLQESVRDVRPPVAAQPIPEPSRN